MDQNQLKKLVAEAALKFVPDDCVVGVGSGSTVNCFIDALAGMKGRIDGAVAASEASAQRLKQHGIRVYDLNAVDKIPVYIDGADEINHYLQMIKGGGAALTREKIVSSVAEQFICIADASKLVDILGKFPLPVEVVPMARSHVARELVKLGGNPVWREGVVTDNGNQILDIHNLQITDPEKLERELNQLPGVVCVGLFARRRADVVIVGGEPPVVL